MRRRRISCNDGKCKGWNRECIGLKWNEKKCAVIHVKRRSLVSDAGSVKIGGLKPINCLREDSHYKFLGVRESVR